MSEVVYILENIIVKVIFYGWIAKKTGQKEIEVSVSPSTSINQLFNFLSTLPELEENIDYSYMIRNNTILIMINNSDYKEGRILQTGDIVRLLPFISGG